MAIPKTKHHSRSSDKTRRRTSRACDRCRLKKSKCDGTTPCKTCQASDSKCMYTARRGREARSYYYHMREVTDEALQRLYWACRGRSGFPGTLPDESNGPPSTNAIIDALGLMRPSLEDNPYPENMQTQINPSTSASPRPHRQSVSRSSTESTTQEGYLPSPSQSSFSISSAAPCPKPMLAVRAGNQNPSRPSTPPEMDMSEQFLCAASEHSSSRSNSSSNGAEQPHLENPSSLAFDMDAYLDTSSCSIAIDPTNVIHNSMHNPTQFDMPTMMDNGEAVQPMNVAFSHLRPVTDGYLSPWPGSLAAVYHPHATSAH